MLRFHAVFRNFGSFRSIVANIQSKRREFVDNLQEADLGKSEHFSVTTGTKMPLENIKPQGFTALNAFPCAKKGQQQTLSALFDPIISVL